MPLTTLAFSTIPPQVRPEGAALFALIRSMGSSIGVSVTPSLLVYNSQAMHGSLAGALDASHPVTRAGLASSTLPGASGLVALNGEVAQQAQMVAYVDDYVLLVFVTVVCIVALPLLRRPRS